MTGLRDIAERIAAVPLRNGRRIVAIAGAPASGKSTLAENLSAVVPNSCVLPMDGFHLSNETLEKRGLLLRKGAPETFDVAGFAAIVRDAGVQGDVLFPTFDRSKDCVVPSGGRIRASDTTILAEGNYLLLDHAPWSDLASLWDFSIRLEVPLAELQDRLVRRWLDHGHTAEEALGRARRNDLPNASFMTEHALPADIVVSLNE